MAALYGVLAELKSRSSMEYWAARIRAELEYAAQVSMAAGGEFDGLVAAAAAAVSERLRSGKALGEDEVRSVEELLSPMSSAAKSYGIICAAHAHIDMNWMWRFDETVAITIDTLSTMLQLMDEYPDFHFSQSQASVYRIIEQYAPELLERLRSRVHEGRFEVTASTWVEADRNLPTGESMVRQILYTRRYLSGLLGISPESLDIDFEPDTFGHSINVPEVLADAGIKYYYHCRGTIDGPHIRRWVSPSGRSVILYRELLWYNDDITGDMAAHVPGFCRRYGIRKMLRVYGVGDHGGGPTRRDITRLLDMQTWPIYPVVEFGSLRDWFRSIEGMSDALPCYTGELNFVFTGCYTSQSRIKAANRAVEGLLVEAELFNSLGQVHGLCNYPASDLAQSWEYTLFNQFHDIIPGSCTADSREYAMGMYQRAFAASGTARTRALRAFASNIDTSSMLGGGSDPESRSAGAGAGFGVDELRVSQVSRGEGDERAFVVFNPSSHRRDEVVEFVLWDYSSDIRMVKVTDASGDVVAHHVLEQGVHQYWGHNYLKLLVFVSVPAYGYATYIVSTCSDVTLAPGLPSDPRIESPTRLVLENELIRVELDSSDCTISSIVCKDTGEELVAKGSRLGYFRYAVEDDRDGMTAWRIGRHKSGYDITQDICLKEVNLSPGALRQHVRYEVPFASSTLSVQISLLKGSPQLHYSVECHWREIGEQGKGVPSLSFCVPLPYRCSSFRYDVPFGTIDRSPLDMDVPANSIAAAIPEDDRSHYIALTSDSKHGFRGTEQSLSLSLIRSSYNPDPYPEVGVHRFRIGLLLLQEGSHADLLKHSYDFSHPMSVVSTGRGSGVLQPTGSLLSISGGPAVVSSVKAPEGSCAGNEVIIRLFETEGESPVVALSFGRRIAGARLVTIDEVDAASADQPSVDGESVHVRLRPYSLTNVRITFA
jgi:alpha-mannosidase